MSDYFPQRVFDCHIHIWDAKHLNMPWLPLLPNLKKHYSLSDYQKALGDMPTTKVTYIDIDVDKADLAKEAEIILGIAGEQATIASIVLGADLRQSDFLEFVEHYAEKPNITGIRHNFRDANDESIFCHHKIIEHLRALPDYDIHFELAAKSQFILAASELPTICSETQFVINHCGMINAFETDNSIIESWKHGMEKMAKQPNTLCKISGLLHCLTKHDWEAEDLAEIINFCLDIFGEDRVMFASNWPLVTTVSDIPSWFHAMLKITHNRSAEFKDKLFYKNAEKFYLRKEKHYA